MRTKLLVGLAAAMVLAVAAVAFAGALTTAAPAVAPVPVKPAQLTADSTPCCTVDDCCLECILCCSSDGCCEDCIQCCIEMGCDPFCCFPALTGKVCCSDGCCK